MVPSWSLSAGPRLSLQSAPMEVSDPPWHHSRASRGTRGEIRTRMPPSPCTGIVARDAWDVKSAAWMTESPGGGSPVKGGNPLPSRSVTAKHLSATSQEPVVGPLHRRVSRRAAGLSNRKMALKVGLSLPLHRARWVLAPAAGTRVQSGSARPLAQGVAAVASPPTWVLLEAWDTMPR